MLCGDTPRSLILKRIVDTGSHSYLVTLNVTIGYGLFPAILPLNPSVTQSSLTQQHVLWSDRMLIRWSLAHIK